MTLDQIIRDAKEMTPRARELALFAFLGRAWSLPQSWNERICKELEGALADGKGAEHVK